MYHTPEVHQSQLERSCCCCCWFCCCCCCWCWCYSRVRVLKVVSGSYTGAESAGTLSPWNAHSFQVRPQTHNLTCSEHIKIVNRSEGLKGSLVENKCFISFQTVCLTTRQENKIDKTKYKLNCFQVFKFGKLSFNCSCFVSGADVSPQVAVRCHHCQHPHHHHGGHCDNCLPQNEITSRGLWIQESCREID